MSTVLTDKVVITRKPHICWGCGEMYEKGSKMRYSTYADEGTVNSAYWCETCDYIMVEHYTDWDLDNGVGFAAIKENDSGFWISEKRELEKRKQET